MGNATFSLDFKKLSGEEFTLTTNIYTLMDIRQSELIILNVSSMSRNEVGQKKRGLYTPPPLSRTLFPMVFLDQYIEGVEKKNSPQKKLFNVPHFGDFSNFKA